MIKCHLSELMGKHKHTQQDVIRLTGLSQNVIRRLYHETSDGVQWKTVEAICKMYGCSVGELFEYLPDGS